MKIHKKIIEQTWTGAPHGYGNGYVGVELGHPWYEKNYNDIDSNVHGGLTWSDHEVGGEKTPDIWWLGFDTAHGGDNKHNCPREYVESEVESLYQQALEAAR